MGPSFGFIEPGFHPEGSARVGVAFSWLAAVSDACSGKAGDTAGGGWRVSFSRVQRWGGPSDAREIGRSSQVRRKYSRLLRRPEWRMLHVFSLSRAHKRLR